MREIADLSRHAGLGERLRPGEVHAEPADQLDTLLFDPPSLYRGRTGHLVIFGCRHNTG